MRLLFDQNLSFRLCKILTDVFPGSVHVSNVGLAAALDTAIWRYAGDKGLTLVSHDSDFAELAVLAGPPPNWFGSAAAIAQRTRSPICCANIPLP